MNNYNKYFYNLNNNDFKQILMFVKKNKKVFFGITNNNEFTYMDGKYILKLTDEEYSDIMDDFVDNGWTLCEGEEIYDNN